LNEAEISVHNPVRLVIDEGGSDVALADGWYDDDSTWC
jgi:hypothetical protein